MGCTTGTAATELKHIRVSAGSGGFPKSFGIRLYRLRVIHKSGGKMIGVNWPKLRAQIDESRNYLFQKAGYKLDIFSA
jgi:hypothetical protein